MLSGKTSFEHKWTKEKKKEGDKERRVNTVRRVS